LRILILKPSSLGDVVQALPVLRLLKQHRPDSEIHWWLGVELRELLAGDPDLARILPFDRRRWASPLRWHHLLLQVRHVRALHFDWVIDLQGLARSGLFAWWAGGGLTIGLDDLREGASAFYDRRVPRPSPNAHAVDWYLAVLKALGVPVHGDFDWLPPSRAAAEAVRRKWRPEPGQWIVINPGARWPTKRWPAEHFRELVARLARDQPAFRFVVLGSREDAVLGRQIAQGNAAPCLDLTGQTSLPEMVEWVRLADLMITNDTGPMHVAAALGKPVVALFGPTDPRRTGPYGQTQHVLQLPLPCAPCLKAACHYAQPLACLRALDPAMVQREAQRRLRAGLGNHSGWPSLPRFQTTPEQRRGRTTGNARAL
jgi:lipopolysaccharide heptosyltransferase I